MSMTQWRRARWHITHVMAWGYSFTEAFRVCKDHGWFGDEKVTG